MGHVAVDAEKCKVCGACLASCPAGIFMQESEGAPSHTDHIEFCIGCGHCVALCPSGAITHPRFPEGTVHPIDRDALPTYNQILELVRARRSVRVFDDEPPAREDIEKMLDAARFAASAHNARDTQVVVVQDKGVLASMVDLTVAFLLGTRKQLQNPIARTIFKWTAPHMAEQAMAMLPEIDLMEQGVAAGFDPILRNAPCVLVFHAAKSLNFPDANANLALDNAALAGQALGLGGFYTGYIVAACKKGKGIPELLGLPSHHAVFAGYAFGKPRIPFGRWVERPALPAKWL